MVEQTSNRLFDNRLDVCLHDTAGCQTGCLTTVVNEQTVRSTGLSNRLYNRFDSRVEQTATVRSAVLNEQPLFVQPVVKPGCTTGLTTGCIHDTTGCQTGLITG